jgi:hypothetical protein
MGPLKADLLRRAKTKLEEGEYSSGVGAASLKADGISPVLTTSLGAPPGPRTSRILLGKRADEPGVVGRTLMELCGDLEILAVGVATVSMLFDEIEDALEWARV